MSKWETPLTRRFWREVGGTLIEEFPAVRRGMAHAQRLLDGVIVLDGPFERRRAEAVDIAGKDIVVVQAKAKRLGMYLMGQAVFSAQLMERFGPASIRSVAICTKGDEVLEPLVRAHGVEVVVYPPAQPSAAADAAKPHG